MSAQFDIKGFDPLKNKIRTMFKVFKIFYGKRYQQAVHETIKHSGNPIVAEIYNILDHICKDVIFDHHDKHLKDRYREMVRDPVEIGLAIVQNDSAFSDLFIYFLLAWHETCEKKPEIIEYLKANVKEPRHMYCNIWTDNKRMSNKLEKEGKVLASGMCESEWLQVDDAQKGIVESIDNQIKKHDKSISRW